MDETWRQARPTDMAPRAAWTPARPCPAWLGAPDTLFVPREPHEYKTLKVSSLPPVPDALWGNPVLDVPWVTYDLETTGLLKDEPRVLELGCVVTRADRSRVAFTSLVQPDRDFGDVDAIWVHRITPDHVAHAPQLPEAHARLENFLTRHVGRRFVLGGYNIEGFDNEVLALDARRQGASWPFHTAMHLDMQKAFIIEKPYKNKGDKRSLAVAVEMTCGRQRQLAHGAESDAIDASDVLFGLGKLCWPTGARLTERAEHYRHLPNPMRRHHRQTTVRGK